MQALQAAVRRSQSLTFILLIPGDIVGPDDAVVTGSLVWPARCLPPDWLLTGDHTSDGGAGAWPRGPHLVRSERVTGPRQASPGQIRSQSRTHGDQWQRSMENMIERRTKIPKVCPYFCRHHRLLKVFYLHICYL